MNAVWKLMVAVALFGLIPTSAARAEALWLNRMIANASAVNATADCAAPAPSCAAPAPSCAAPAPTCCQPKISYNHVCVHRVCCCGCKPPIESVLNVKDPGACNPCTVAPVAIPVCLPACCTGEPTVCARVGLFGRGIVRYDYCCGLSIKVVFLNCGDIAVTYIGA